MLALARYAFCAAALMLITASALAQSLVTNPAATCAITGRVTINGQPVPGVMLRLQLSTSGPPSVPPLPWKATTNHDGRYQFTGVAAGGYTVAPFTAAFVLLLRESAGPVGKTLTLAEGKTADGIDVTLRWADFASRSASRPLPHE